MVILYVCAFATGLAMFLGNGVIMNGYYAKVIGLDILRFWKEIGEIVVVVLFLTLLGYVVNLFAALSTGLLVFLGKVLLYTSFYLVVIFMLCMNDEEKNKLLNLINYINNFKF